MFSPQTKRIIKHMRSEYGAEPEFLLARANARRMRFSTCPQPKMVRDYYGRCGREAGAKN